MHLAYPPPPPKFCITTVFDFSWDDCEIPRRNWKQWPCKILGGKQGALHYGLCENGDMYLFEDVRKSTLKF